MAEKVLWEGKMRLIKIKEGNLEVLRFDTTEFDLNDFIEVLIEWGKKNEEKLPEENIINAQKAIIMSVIGEFSVLKHYLEEFMVSVEYGGEKDED